MSNVYDVKADVLIEAVADKLSKMPKMSPPEWARFVKTGVHKERPPLNDDWWFIRAAAILRKIYILGPIGTSKLRTKFGGTKRRGYAPARFRKASGSVIRHILQQLEKSGLAIQVSKNGHKGRIVAPKGKSLLDKTASEIAQKKE
jgi:small subunit ribosomal protein S19e